MPLNDFLLNNLPFSLNLLPEGSYLVGGAVRDALLNRERDYLDLDFVTPNSAIAIAKKIASLYKAGFVVLDQQRNIARVVFDDATIDIAQQEGESLLNDLSRRDYTINAIAYNCAEQKIIDPLQGQKDLQEEIIRMVSKDNLREDPLRLLRGYRQACQLDFQIEDSTRQSIKKLVYLLPQVAEERINHELGYLLAHPRGSFWLQEVFEDNLLSVYFPELTQMQINFLTKIDHAMEWLGNSNTCLATIDNSWRSLAKLACLTNRNPEIAEQELINLKYSRQEIKTVLTLLQYTGELQTIDFATNLRSQYFFFKSVGQIFPILAIFALAHNLEEDLILMLIDRYCDHQDKVAHPQPLLSGNDLIKSLQISPSPLIGELLIEVQVAYIEGKISNKEEAIPWLTKYNKQLN